MVVGEGFEPSKLSRQIYSLIPLTARESHLYKYLSPIQPKQHSIYTLSLGAGTRSRTRDLLITSQLLYQLSYTGFLMRGAEV